MRVEPNSTATTARIDEDDSSHKRLEPNRFLVQPDQSPLAEETNLEFTSTATSANLNLDAQGSKPSQHSTIISLPGENLQNSNLFQSKEGYHAHI